MHFLRTKVNALYQYSKNILQNKQKTAQGKRIIHNQLKSTKDNVNLDVLQKLSQLSFDPHEYTEIFNYLIVKIAEFQYEQKTINKSLKLITILSHLLKTANTNFSKDMCNNIDILQRLQKLNSHYFQSTHPLNTKQLQYKLQLIKQRSKFILMLLQDEKLLQKERENSILNNYKQPSEPTEGETAFGLQNNIQKQKLSTSKRTSAKRIEQVSSNSFHTEETSPKPSNKPFCQLQKN